MGIAEPGGKMKPTEIHDTETCACDLCKWASKTPSVPGRDPGMDEFLVYDAMRDFIRTYGPEAFKAQLGKVWIDERLACPDAS